MMKFLTLAAAMLTAVPAISGLVINTPTNVVQCQPIMLTFGSGTSPYYVSAIPGGQVSAAPLKTWDATDASSITWIVDLPSGAVISFIVKDGTGAQAYSDQVTILSSGDSSCLDASSTAASAGTAGHASVTPATTSHAASGSPSQGTTGSVGRATPATQSASSNVSNSVNANSDSHLDVGAHWVVGAVGVIGALLV